MSPHFWGFPIGSMGKESTCNAGDAGDAGLIPQLRRSLEEGMTTHTSILAWRIPWTEEPGELQSIGSQSLKQLSMQTLLISRPFFFSVSTLS